MLHISFSPFSFSNLIKKNKNWSSCESGHVEKVKPRSSVFKTNLPGIASEVPKNIKSGGKSCLRDAAMLLSAPLCSARERVCGASCANGVCVRPEAPMSVYIARRRPRAPGAPLSDPTPSSLLLRSTSRLLEHPRSGSGSGGGG